MTDNNIKRPLWIKLTAYGFAAVFFSSIAIGGAAWYRQSIMNEEALAKELESDLTLVQSDMDGQKKLASSVALALAGEPETGPLIEAGSREEILKRFENSLPQIVEAGGVQLITFVSAKGEAVARIHAPDKFGDDMTGRRKTIVNAISSGKLVAGTEPGRTAVSMFASAPVIRDGTVVGVVDAGTSLTNDYFKPLAEKIEGEIGVYVMVEGKLTQQASTYGEKPMLSEDDLKAAFDGQPERRMMSEAGRHFVVEAAPFENFSGARIGVIVIASDVTPIVEGSSSAVWTTVTVSAVVAILGALGFLLFARSLAGAISRMTATMSRLAANDMSVEVSGADRPDELGAMAKALQVFKDNAQKTLELENMTAEQRAQVEAERRRASDLEHARAEAMAKATSTLANGLSHLASGDLSFQIDQPLPEDFESLRNDFNRAVSQLRETLSAVSVSAGAIDGGTREISQSADDLSKRTEQQAASLEETAAALDQITVNVTNSSKRAEEARTVAIQANESARKSGSVVASAVDAMGKIEQSSGQISNIIGVIDDIAFQTNLLALNAGVEAARAGEAGKGFAVVAQEVRELAQRSAKAAKEIKDLIRNSSEEVESGVRLVSETGQVLKTIEDYIVTINQHMDSIATSAREQSVGLSEVNTAVNQMDQVTQQNAAMVEEANAASATLASEANRLRDLINRFQLGQVASGAGALRATAAMMAAPSRSATTAQARPAPRQMASGGAAAAAASKDWEEF
ncbi:methyl-accepting chemotaxis protein [Ciceribacter sp. L1K22]|uniref:methyl-accepting chemotaxis protein n=1 Tax=Ciceribacter sp. L1K22 TaxID=2820275 RepID=UPI001ABED3D0|nr:methyl-accepting chemotaxis protein [Ciceribacter sp. L1K22]MBO3758226.1 HAMP domain-containing protein [Ciceribacter sp. L1K22]